MDPTKPNLSNRPRPRRYIADIAAEVLRETGNQAVMLRDDGLCYTIAARCDKEIGTNIVNGPQRKGTPKHMKGRHPDDICNAVMAGLESKRGRELFEKRIGGRGFVRWRVFRLKGEAR